MICCVHSHRRNEPSGDFAQRPGLLENLVHMTVDRRRPPPSFFAAAWCSMFNTLLMRVEPVREMASNSVLRQDGHTQFLLMTEVQ